MWPLRRARTTLPAVSTRHIAASLLALAALVVAFAGIPACTTTQVTAGTGPVLPPRRTVAADWERLPADSLPTACLSSANQAPDSAHLAFWPVRYIRLRFHVVDDARDPLNLDSVRGPDRIRSIVYTANEHLSDLRRPALPVADRPPRTQSRFRLAFAGDPGRPGDDGIDFHDDPDVPRHVHKGRGRNLGDGTAYRRYGSGADSTLDVFLLPYAVAPDRRARLNPTATAGVAFGARYIKLIGHYSAYAEPWHHHRSLIHEVAHVFTVRHTWAEDDGCDDTPRHRHCWNVGAPAGCGADELSNNIMDYTALAATFTRCQVGRVHAAIAREGSVQRRYVLPTWCEGSGGDVSLRDTFVVRHAADLDGGITLHPGAYLEVRCRLSIPAGRRITVLPGATLALAGGRLHNACGEPWEGVYLSEGGRVLWREGSALENAAGGLRPVRR